MVKGQHEVPLCTISSTYLTGECVFQVFREVVKWLERIGSKVPLFSTCTLLLYNTKITVITELQVLGATLDGAPNNQNINKVETAL